MGTCWQEYRTNSRSKSKYDYSLTIVSLCGFEKIPPLKSVSVAQRLVQHSYKVPVDGSNPSRYIWACSRMAYAGDLKSLSFVGSSPTWPTGLSNHSNG